VRFIAERTSTLHERAVAENVCALLDAEGHDAKAIVWAHNDHVARAVDQGGDSLGAHLDAMVGRAQVVIGFSFGAGAFQARDFPFGALFDHRVAAAPPETFDATLAQAGLPLFCLDLAHAPADGEVAAWLAREMPMRSIGGIFGLPADNPYGVSYSRAIVPRRWFDAVLFVADTTASRRNRERPSGAAMPALAVPANLELAGDGVPIGWHVSGADPARACAVQASAARSPAGGRTVRLARGASAPRWGDIRLVQKVSAKAWRGKRLQIAATIRTETDGLGGALLLIKSIAHADGSSADFYAGEVMQAASTEQPMQSSEWTPSAVMLDVSPEADEVIFGLVMTGTGTAWFGDLVLAPM
jgi:erythromycin esterase